MLRFIFNFIFFGVLFYLIWHFFPDAFETLVRWAQNIYEFIVEIATRVIEWISEVTKPGTIVPSKPTAGALLQMLSNLF